MLGEKRLTEFAQQRKAFIVDGLRRFGEKGVNPYSGESYGEQARAFNDIHPEYKIDLEVK